MRLLLKHLTKSVGKSPMQPLFILLALIVATVISVTAAYMPSVFISYADEAFLADAELGDMAITNRDDAPSRLLDAKEVADFVASDGDCLADFPLTAFRDGEILGVSALDLLSADGFYLFKFTEYGRFTNLNINTSAIISEGFAKRAGLSVGDGLSFRILDKDLCFTVEAVAKGEGILAERDVLIQIDALRDIIAETIPELNALPDSFMPYTRVLVKANAPAGALAIAKRLADSGEFDEMHISELDGRSKYDYYITVSVLMLTLPAVLLVALAAVVISALQELLYKKRSTELSLFAAVGAEPRQISLLLISESLFYSLLGGGVGVAISYPVLLYMRSLYDWQGAPPEINPVFILIGLVAAPVIILSSTLYRIRKTEVRSIHERINETETVSPIKENIYLQISLLILSAALFVAQNLVEVRYRIYITAALFISLLILLFFSLPLIFRAIFSLFERLYLCFVKKSGSLLFTLKNFRRCTPLAAVGRLCVLIVSVFILLSVSVSTLSYQMNSIVKSARSEYIAANASEELEEYISELDGVREVYRIAYIDGIELDTDMSAIAYSLENKKTDCFSAELTPGELPTGDGAVLSNGIADLLGASVGDKIKIAIRGVEYFFTVSGIMDTPVQVVYFDAEYIGIERNLLLVDIDDGYADGGALYAKMTQAAEKHGAMLTTPERIFREMKATADANTAILSLAIYIGLAISLAGAANMLYSQHTARAGEREILYSVGLSRGDIRKREVIELTLVGIAAIILALPIASLFLFMLDFAVRSFGMTLF